MNLIIRHGKDKKGKYSHDERLTASAKEDIYQFTEKMVQEFGFPDLIYYSPMLRTRQTTKYILRKLKELKEVEEQAQEQRQGREQRQEERQGENNFVKIKCEPKLGRYFNTKERRDPDVHESSMRRGVIIEDNKQQFHSRIKKHLRKVINKAKKSNIKIWNITHTLVLLHVAEILSIDHNPHVEYLDYVKL